MLRQGGSAGLEARDNAGGDFSAMLRRAAERAADPMLQGENQTVQAAAGTADLTQVVMAVSKAEMTLETVVTLRDKVVQAYQDRTSTRLNSSHYCATRMPSSA